MMKNNFFYMKARYSPRQNHQMRGSEILGSSLGYVVLLNILKKNFVVHNDPI